MAVPQQTQFVVVREGAEYEVIVQLAESARTVGDLLELLGEPEAYAVLDGTPVARDAELGSVRLRRGARLELAATPPPQPAWALWGTTPVSAGEIIHLGRGTHGDGSVDAGVQVRGPQGGAARLCVDEDGAILVEPREGSVLVDGSAIPGPVRAAAGCEITVGGAGYRLGAAPPREQGATYGAVAFNRPPRTEYPASLPLLAAPSAPPEAPQPMRFGWGALLAPLLFGGVAALVWNPVMAAFALLSPLLLISNWADERRRTKRANAAAADAFDAALAEFGRRLDDVRRMAHVMAWRTTPGPAQLGPRIVAGDGRLWQRRPDHPDFMQLSLGVGAVPWEPEVQPAAPDRAAAVADILRTASPLRAVPVTTHLAGAVLGLAGPRSRILETARWLLVEAAAHHGPADLRIAVVTEDPAAWDWLKWLPHATAEGDHAGVTAAEPGAVEALLAPFLVAEEAVAPEQVAGPGPRLLLVADVIDFTSSSAATVRRALAGETRGPVAGIALAPSVATLPAVCRDIVRVAADGQAIVWRPRAGVRLGPFSSWRLPAAGARRLARTLGGWCDPELRTVEAELPAEVHLLDLIAPEGLSTCAVARRWAAAGAAPQCVAPIGVGPDGPVFVDWTSDGPHGLLAGTTGSGKSELLRTLVAALAASVGPEQLNFVLIDYKGGSAFDACDGLPHTTGVVTDLDGHLAQRVLTCLEAELRRREEILRGAAVADVAAYQAGTAAGGDPLARLLVVIDEFAALAMELPDFMASLVDIARRGRSLGVHLLLATQRPQGVINDAIRANTNLRISLRVQDGVDSADVIGTTAAAAIPRSRAGRGLLRRGPGDVVPFQAALVTGRSGAVATSTVRPFTVRARGVAPAGGGTGPSDLERLVAAVTAAAAAAGMEAAGALWPDPLPYRLELADLAPCDAPGVAVGLVDEPARQRQLAYAWQPDDNMIIYGGPGAGTSTALRTIITAACSSRSPSDLHVYVLDFDDQSLLSLEALPHVGAAIGPAEPARQRRLLRYVQQEIAVRREQAGSRARFPAERPRIVLAVDNYGGFRAAFDDPADLAFKEALGRIVAAGPGVGVSVVATARQPTDVPAPVAAVVATKLVMRLADRYDYSGLGVADPGADLPPGRAFDAATGREIQLAAPPGDADAAMATAPVPGREPWSIELLPAEVKIPDIAGGAEVFDLEWRVPVALGDDRLEPVGWTLREGDHVLIAGPVRSGKSTTLATVAAVLHTARPDMAIIALAPRGGPLAECTAVDVVCRDERQLLRVLAGVAPAEPHAVLIDDAAELADAGGAVAGLVASRDRAARVFAAGEAAALRAGYGHWSQALARTRLGLALSPDAVGGGELWGVTLPRIPSGPFPAGRGYLLSAGGLELVQVAWQ